MGYALLALHELTRYQFNLILDTARKIKQQPGKFRARLKHRIQAHVCETGDFRVPLSFRIAGRQLGGSVVDLEYPAAGRRENPAVIARTLERWVDGIMVRVRDSAVAAEIAESVRIPVINGGCSLFDPCRGLNGIFTLREFNRDPACLHIVTMGTSRAALNAWTAAAAFAGSRLTACPAGTVPDDAVLARAAEIGRETGFRFEGSADVEEALAAADVLVVAPADAGEEKATPPFGEKTAEMRKGALIFSDRPEGGETGKAGGSEIEPRNPAYEGLENSLHIQKAIMVLLYERQL
jgi:ornithine carbamoyltransferase